jgi:uncharacterized protein (DUF1501 family)
MNRRKFIKLSAVTATLLSPMARTVGGLSLSSTMLNANTQTLDGYKALVVLFLEGGNDAMNMFVPTNPSTHAQYSQARLSDDDTMAVSIDDLSNTNFTKDANGHYIKNSGTNHPYYDAPQEDDGLSTSAKRSYKIGSYHINNQRDNTASGLGINSMMPELKAMYDSGNIAIVSNVGTLVEPTTKSDIENDSANLPVFLFAHNHQTRAVFTAQAEQLANTGWAGRIADNWNINEPVGLNISYGGMKRLLIGQTSSPLIMPTDTPVSYSTKYNNFAQKGDYYESLLNKFSQISNDNPFSRFYTNKSKKAGELSTLLLESMEQAPDFSTFSSTNTYGQSLFTVPSMENDIELTTHDDTRDSIFKQLEAAAKMIKVSKDTLSHPRQVIYVKLGGFDTHSSQTTNHAINLRSLSIALSDFQKALKEMSLDDKVLTVCLSEFGRTLKSNSDGTDHGWGGHGFVMNSSLEFNGGNVYGDVLDDLNLDGANTYTEKGRIIPTTSIEQMMAPCLKWFGVANEQINTILPNLVNFTNHSNTANMESMFN